MTNPAKVWALLIALSISCLAIGHTFFGRPGLFFGLLIALGINFLVFFYGDARLIVYFKGRRIEGQDGWGLIEKTAQFSRRASIPRPTLFVIPLETPTAFALGHTWHNSAVVFSEGLIKALTTEEMEVVIALEVARIKSLDTFSSGATQVLAYALLGLGRWIDYLWLPNLLSKKREFRFKPFSTILYPVAWGLVRLTVSTQSLLANDAYAVSLLGDPHRLAELLWKLDSYATTRPFTMPALAQHLFIVSPQARKQKLFLTQPSVEHRIRNLVGYYPI